MLDLNDQNVKMLEFKTEEKVLGVIIFYKLNFSRHIVTQIKEANKMMGLIRCSYTHLDRTSFLCLLNFLVRPHLEYCVSIWYLLLKRAIKVPSMRYRRMWGDMILVYKILRGLYAICLSSMDPGLKDITLNFLNHLLKLQYVNIFSV